MHRQTVPLKLGPRERILVATLEAMSGVDAATILQMHATERNWRKVAHQLEVNWREAQRQVGCELHRRRLGLLESYLFARLVARQAGSRTADILQLQRGRRRSTLALGWD